MKACCKCGETKPLGEFHRHKGRSDGRSSYCKVCACANSRAWNAANAERKSAQGKVHYEANREKYAESGRQWRERNPEAAAEGKRRAKEKLRRENRPAYLARKRLEMKQRRVTGDSVAYAQIIAQDPCSYCGGSGGTIDHIEPIKTGGDNHWSNLTGACHSCNSKKQARPLLVALMDMEVAS